MTTMTEADVEQAALDWLHALGWQAAHGPDIAPDTPNAERGGLRTGNSGPSAAGCPILIFQTQTARTIHDERER